MTILLGVKPDEFILGIVLWVLLILGIIVLVKFLQISKDIRSIKGTIEEIADALIEERKKIKTTPPKHKTVSAVKKAFINDCLRLYKLCHSKEEFESKVDDIITKYNKIDNFDYSTLKSGLWEQFKQL